MLFNKNNTGGDELRELLGFIDASSNFDKWKTWINLSTRQITSFTGQAIFDKANEHYNSSNYKFEKDPDTTYTELTTPKLSEINAWSELDELVTKLQLANALFAYVKLLPSLDAGHSNGGRKKSIGTEERALTAVEAYKDESNILSLAYEAMEDILYHLESTKDSDWLASDTRKSTANLLIQNLDTFNQYFAISSARLFYTLVPMMREVQNLHIVPIISADTLTNIITALNATNPTEEQQVLITLTQDYIRRPLVLSTMALALKRLPIELLPEGIVQTQIVGTVKEKVVANEQTRQSLISSLQNDARIGLTALQEQMAVYNGAIATERYVEPPAYNTEIKGFRF